MSTRNPNNGGNGGMPTKNKKKSRREKDRSRCHGKGRLHRSQNSDLIGGGHLGELYQYLESGLDDVKLENGFEFHDGEDGREISIDNIEGLHYAIACDLVEKEQRLSGREFRFLRTELSLSQASLAQILGVKELTVGRWEKSDTDIPLATDAVLRKMYSETIVGKRSKTMRQLLETIADLEEAIDEKVIKLGSNQEWKITKKAS